MELGVGLSSEELGPHEIVAAAVHAEAVGFTTAWVSDHYHPWIDAQGQSPFVWTVLGGIAEATSTIRVGTGVTCPIMRVHPAVLAQASATTQCMFDGRFWFGVGSGEALNEHIVRDEVARDRRTPGDARGSGGADPTVVARRADEPLREALQCRERTALHTSRAAAADHRVGLRREVDGAGHAHR